MKTRGRPGQTLIEVVMATVIAAMTASAVFSVVLSSFVADARADKRDAAAMALRQAQQALKVYVSVAPNDPNYSPGAVAGRWAADGSGQWALRNGNHNITSLLAGTPIANGGSFTYNVTSYDCGFGLGTPPNYELACKQVSFSLTYTD
ncbi:MAG: hypothetical protein AB7V08_02305 [Elusimicrobiales bacterium]